MEECRVAGGLPGKEQRKEFIDLTLNIKARHDFCAEANTAPKGESWQRIAVLTRCHGNLFEGAIALILRIQERAKHDQFISGRRTVMVIGPVFRQRCP